MLSKLIEGERDDQSKKEIYSRETSKEDYLSFKEFIERIAKEDAPKR